MKICNECGEHTEGMDRNNRGLYCTVCCANLAGAQDAPKPKRKRARKKQAPMEEEKQAPVEEE